MPSYRATLLALRVPVFVKRPFAFPRPGWKFWLVVAACLGLAEAAGAALGAQAAVAGVQRLTRYYAGHPPAQDDALDQVTRGFRFNLIGWEARELGRWAFDALATPPGVPAPAELSAVNRFFELGAAMQRAELRLAAADSDAARSQARAGIQTLRRERDAIETTARRTVTRLVTVQMQQSGLGYRAPGHIGVLPPVAFTVVRPPSVLVIAPRDRIKLERTTILQPGLADGDGERMEADAEALGWSAIVAPTGGFSTYPTIISDSVPLDFTLQTVGHEWMHTYLFFHPLGFNYFSSSDMRTINETVANLVGREVARGIRRSTLPPPVTPALAPATPQPATATPADPAAEPPFDFNREMRTTRLEAERLLTEGRVAEAEGYMEDRRKLLVAHGYTIRKLNQAYFAFHDLYADTPGSVSPIGPALEQLLQKTGSVQAFVRSLQDVASYAGYQQVLARYGIAETPPRQP